MMNNLDSICARVESARRDRLRKVVLRRENFIKKTRLLTLSYSTGGHSSVQPSQKLDIIRAYQNGPERLSHFPQNYRFDMYENRKYKKNTLSKEGV